MSVYIWWPILNFVSIIRRENMSSVFTAELGTDVTPPKSGVTVIVVLFTWESQRCTTAANNRNLISHYFMFFYVWNRLLYMYMNFQ